MNAPLVFGLDYYGPRLPTGPGPVIVQLDYVPNCLKAPIRPSLLATHFPIFPGFPSGQGTFFFQSQCWNLCCAEERTRPGMSPSSHQGTCSPSVSPSSLLASVCTPIQAPSVRLEDGQEDPHKRKMRETSPAQPLLRSKLLVVSCPSS